MPRVPENTITKTPVMIRQGQPRDPHGMAGAGAGIAAMAAAFETPINREHEIRRQAGERLQRSISERNAKIEQIQHGVGVLNTVLERRANLLAQDKLADAELEINRRRFGYVDESGQRHAGTYETQFSPGTEDGEGGSNAQTLTQKMVSEVVEGVKLDGRAKEIFMRRIRPIADKAITGAMEADVKNYEMWRQNTAARTVQAKVDAALMTGSQEDVDAAAAEAAFAKIPPAAIVNYNEVRSAEVFDPAALEFVNDTVKAEYEASFAEYSDKFNADVLRNRLRDAINATDDMTADAIFSQLEGFADRFFSPDIQSQAKESLGAAALQRAAVVQRRNSATMAEGKAILYRSLIGRASEGDAERFDAIAEQLPAEMENELELFREDLSKNLELGGFEKYRLEVMDGINNGDDYAEGMNKLTEYVNGMRNLAAKERALAWLQNEAAATVKGTGISGGTEKISNPELNMWRRFSRDTPEDLLEKASAMVENGFITPIQFVQQVDGLRKDAEDNLDPHEIINGMREAGLKFGQLFKRDKDGMFIFGADGRPKPVGGALKDLKQKQTDWMSKRNKYWWDSEYLLTADMMMEVYELAREWKLQQNSGRKMKEATLGEFLREKIIKTGAYQQWNEESMREVLRENKIWLEDGREFNLGEIYWRHSTPGETGDGQHD